MTAFTDIDIETALDQLRVGAPAGLTERTLV